MRCWTCNTDHDLDEACGRPAYTRTAGEHLFDDAAPDPRPDLRAFPARYRSECPDCWEDIWPGDMIVGSDNGYVHVECALKEEE